MINIFNKRNRIPILFLLTIMTAGAQERPCISGEISGGGSIYQWENPQYHSLFTGLKIGITAGNSPLFVKAEGQMRIDPLNGSGQAEFTPGEIYLEYDSFIGTFRAGNQVIRWGQSLALPVLDVICPEDYSHLYRGEEDTGPLPVLGLQWKKGWDYGMAEFLWIPWFKPAILPSDSMETMPGMVYASTNVPELTPANGEWGGRLRFFTPIGDFSTAAFWGWDDLPVTTLSGTLIEGTPTILITPEYHRYLTLGADAAIPVGPLILRGEGALLLNRAFNTMTLDTIPMESNQIMLLGGMDWFSGEWSLVTEFSWSRIFDSGEDEMTLAGEINRKLLQETLTLTLQGLWEPLTGSWYLNPQMEYKPDDGMTLAGGVEIPRGDKGATAWGHNETTGYLRIKLTF